MVKMLVSKNLAVNEQGHLTVGGMDTVELAKEYGTEYINYHDALTLDDGLTMREGISREGIHPNHAGYELMNEVLTPMLDKFFDK